jgi:hypothetical protein
MRSTSSARRRRPRPARPRPIDAVARLIDEATVDEPGHVVVHVVEDGDDEIVLGVRPLPLDVHPFTDLAGLVAPPEWSMFGLRARGTAHDLTGVTAPSRMANTYLLHRSGQEAALLRRGDDVEALTGSAEGVIPDLCHRVLGLPTPPPPGGTALAWTVAWLDRIVEHWGDADTRHAVSSSWASVAVLHPAARTAPDVDLLNLHDPDRLIEVARAHDAAWSWARLRAEPDALPLPEGHLPASVTGWMDDGFYARWALGAFPPAATLVHDLAPLLDEPLRAPFLHVIEGLLR